MSDFVIKAMSGLSPFSGDHQGAQTSVARERQNEAPGGNVLPPGAAKESATEKTVEPEVELSILPESRQTEIHFQPSEIAHRTLITIQDSASGEVVRQIPSKAVVAIAAYLEQYLAEVSPELSAELVIEDTSK